ncbi:hypothetical protein [Haliangium ochraceum]|uniref:Lipoprotein n=1 Tax=Haliangium ochraceum (strain DSM 14365 / JCM 11303 / SMP-2) TaxID=502025 RepID=D0LNW8_HALO1|nr:hypothetical protein [Haliangium ochraceum]ACY18794.1 hypothetical protein Hoch_6324 [Haliangium ochraceum DSM 14365]
MSRIAYSTISMFAALLLTGCVMAEMEEALVDLETGEIAQYMSVDDFQDYYCAPHHQSVTCGVNKTGPMMLQTDGESIQVYVYAPEGEVRLGFGKYHRTLQFWIPEVRPEIIDGEVELVHYPRFETTRPGFVTRAYRNDGPADWRVKITPTTEDAVYHIAVLSD